MNLTEHENKLNELNESYELFKILMTHTPSHMQPIEANACNSCPAASWNLDNDRLAVYCKSRHTELYNSLEMNRKIVIACIDNPLHLIKLKNKTA